MERDGQHELRRDREREEGENRDSGKKNRLGKENLLKFHKKHLY